MRRLKSNCSFCFLAFYWFGIYYHDDCAIKMQKWNLEALENMMQHLSLFFFSFFKFSTGTIIQPFVGPAVFGSDFCSPHISQSLPAILHFLPLILASLGTQSHGSCKAKRAELSSPSQSDNGWQWRSGQISSYTPVHV